MRIDEGLLRWVESSPQPLTAVRFYRWQVPTVSLGKHQDAEQAVGVDYCRCQAIPIVHRPTGGRAVFHAHEITYSVVSNDSTVFPLGKISNTYLAVAEALALGLNRLGIAAQLSRGHPGDPAAAGKKRPCFGSTARHELLFQGRKLAGAAQRQLRRSFLQHGSIPLSVNYPEMARALDADPQGLRASLTSLLEVGQVPLEFERVCQALAEGFESALQVNLSAPVVAESLPCAAFSPPDRQKLRPT